MALPRPVVKAIRLQPPAARPVRETGIVARRVHEGEAGGGDPLGVIVDVHQRRRAALGDGAERLLQDVAEAALLVAGARVVVEAALEAVQVALVLPDEASSSFSATSRLRARFTSRCSAPKISGVSARTDVPPNLGQHVRAVAQGRIGGDAGKGIRSAAVEAQDEFRNRDNLSGFSAAACSMNRAISRRAASTVAPACRRSIAGSGPPGGDAGRSGRGSDRSD